jgi:hypothetical protein
VLAAETAAARLLDMSRKVLLCPGISCRSHYGHVVPASHIVIVNL